VIGIPSRLEIHVHTVDGHVAAFVQEDPERCRLLLEQMQPNRVFAQHHLTIASEHSLTVFPSASIVRIDLVTDDYPGWPFHFGIREVLEITEEEFRVRFDPEAPQEERPGAPVVRYGEIELKNAERVFYEVHTLVEPRTPVELGMFFQQILSAPSLHALRLGGGAVLLNPAQIVRMTFYPGPPVPPPGSWPADPLGGRDTELELDEEI
jgi:hypothetical protein